PYFAIGRSARDPEGYRPFGSAATPEAALEACLAAAGVHHRRLVKQSREGEARALPGGGGDQGRGATGGGRRRGSLRDGRTAGRLIAEPVVQTDYPRQAASMSGKLAANFRFESTVPQPRARAASIPSTFSWSMKPTARTSGAVARRRSSASR